MGQGTCFGSMESGVQISPPLLSSFHASGKALQSHNDLGGVDWKVARVVKGGDC